MRVITAAERLRSDTRMPAGLFHGKALQQLLHETDTPSRVSFVHFEPGAHTMWHTHSGGQVLQIIEGEAHVGVMGETTQVIAAGDTVIAQPGETHWHGAGPNAAMTQLAITCGEILWFEGHDI